MKKFKDKISCSTNLQIHLDNLKFDYLRKEKSFRSEIKNIFPYFTSALFRLTKQISKNVADTTFKSKQQISLTKNISIIKYFKYHCKIKSIQREITLYYHVQVNILKIQTSKWNLENLVIE